MRVLKRKKIRKTLKSTAFALLMRHLSALFPLFPSACVSKCAITSIDYEAALMKRVTYFSNMKTEVTLRICN